MILDKFYTDKYDNDIIFVNPDVTYGEFKKFVYGQIREFESSPIKNTILLGDNYFEFAVNFFASIFANKNIYLISDRTRINHLNFEHILPKKPTQAEGTINTKIDPKNVMINFYTSGSTGEPKPIGKTLHNTEVEAYCTIEEFDIKEDTILVATTSLAHSFGLVFNFILPFVGNCKINQKKIEFPEQLDVKDNYILISTPSFMEKLAKYDFVFEKSPEKLFLAGAKLKPEILNYFKKYTDVIDIYGSTETGNIAFKRDNENFQVFKAVQVTTNENSQIVISSDFFPPDKIVLSDIIEFTQAGKFVVKKRADRIVKILEKRISLDELETHLKRHEKVKDCYCMAYEERIACAVVTDDVTLEKTELRDYLGQYSEILPKRWRFLDEIPRTMNGKVDKAKIHKLFGMNLSLPFVKSRNISENSAKIDLIFKKNCNFFKGHFDVMPILPGVVQIYFAKYFAEDIFNIKISEEEVKKVKFSNIIKADVIMTLKLTLKENSVEFAYVANDITYSSGIFVK